METRTKERTNGHIEQLGFDHPDLATEYDIEYWRQAAFDEGIDLYSSQTQQAIQRRRLAASHTAQNEDRAALLHRFMQFKQVSATITASIVLLLVAFAGYLLPAIAVLGLWIVEIDRVSAGVSSWQISSLAKFVFSLVTVSAYLGLLFRRAMLRDLYPEPEYKASLRLWWCAVRYRFGFLKDDWKPQEKSKSRGINRVILFSAAFIVWLGTLGAMNNQLAQYDEWWISAFASIATETKLVPFLELIGGAFGSAILLVVLHYFVDLAYEQYGQIMPDSERADFFGLGSVEYQSTEADLAEIAHIRNMIERKRQRDSQQ